MTSLPTKQKFLRLRHLLNVGGAFLYAFGLSPGAMAQAINSSALSEDIRDIMVNKPPGSLMPLIFGSIIIAALLLGVWFVSRLAKAPKLVDNGPPADYVALEKLNKISENIDSISLNRASLEVSNTVKDFLSGKFRDPIRFETTEEFFDRISSTDNDDETTYSASLIDQVRSFMNTSQELKFAKLNKGKDQITKLISQAEDIVKAGKKEPSASHKKH